MTIFTQHCFCYTSFRFFVTFESRAVGKSFSTNSTHVWLLLLLFVENSIYDGIIFGISLSYQSFLLRCLKAVKHLPLNYHNDFVFHL